MSTDRSRRLQILLAEVLRLPPGTRSLYVETLEGGIDPDLRRELKQLLAAAEDHPGSSQLPDAMAPVAPGTGHEHPGPDGERIGQTIGQYRLTHLLGAGGMGTVYLAERLTEGFTQHVALKVVQRPLGSQVKRDRFERERQILSGLQHPGIAMFFDGGQTPDGVSFYTMEYVSGEPVTEYCERHELSAIARVNLLLQVATTLAYAHSNLVVHRDIKPSNVLVTPEGRVKLVDFGVAKLLDEHTVPAITVTQTSPAPLTLAYASPEQFLNGTSTVATDIYQFGVLCFVILTGRLPYRASPDDLLGWARAVTEEEPITLAAAVEPHAGERISSAQQVAARFKRQLSRDLDAIVRKSLAKSAHSRYRSMDAMIADLEAFLAGRTVSARPAGPLYFTWRFLQRHWLAASAVLLAVLAIFMVAGIAWRQSRTASDNAERAIREAEVRGVTRAMLTDLLRMAPTRTISERPKSALEALDQGVERTLRVLSEDSQYRTIAAGVLAESYLELHHPQRAFALIERIVPSLVGQDGPLGADQLQLDLLLARAAAELGKLDISEKALQRAEVAMEAEGLPPNSPSRMAASLVHVLLIDHAGHSIDASNLAKQLLDQNDRPGLNDTLEFAEILRVNAVNTMDPDQAADWALRAWQIVAKRYGEDSPAALASQRLTLQYKNVDSEKILSAQEVRLKEAFGEDSLDYAEVLYQHCLRRAQMREYERAQPLCLEAVRIYENASNPESTQLAAAHELEGDMLLRLDKPFDALAHYQRELDVHQATFAPTYILVIQSRLKLSIARCRTGELAKASQEFESAMAAFVAEVGPHHLWEAVHAARFAGCLIDRGLDAAAAEVLEKHGRLDPPRKDMTEDDRAEVMAAWRRLGKGD